MVSVGEGASASFGSPGAGISPMLGSAAGAGAVDAAAAVSERCCSSLPRSTSARRARICAASDGGSRSSSRVSSGLPVPRPFIVSAARLVSGNPELTRELDRLPPSDAAQIRARLADVDRGKEEQQRSETAAAASTAPAPAADSSVGEIPAPGEPKEAEAPSPTLTIANDAAALLAKRMPRSITLREDGLFELSYDDAEYLVDPRGKLVRKESKER